MSITSGNNTERNGGIPVNIQDQTTPPIIVNMNKVTNETTLASAVAIGDRDIVVTSATGIVEGSYLGIFNLTSNRFFAGYVVVGGITGTTITMDSPMDFAYEAGDKIGIGSSNLAVDGSSTTQIFSVRGADPGIDVVLDVTRIIITMTLTSAGDLSQFGNIAGGLVNGCVFRRVDGFTSNIFNVKDNNEIKSLGYDFEFTNAIGQALDGLSSRITFAGQSKMGVVLRISKDDQLQMLIQDNLSSLTSFEVKVEGHLVTD